MPTVEEILGPKEQTIESIIGMRPMEGPKQVVPEPPPFDIDNFVGEWQKTRSMDEEPPQEDVANILNQVTKPFKKLGYSAISSLNRGVAGIAENLNTIFEYSEEKAGRVTPPEKRGYLFKKIADFYEKDSDYWQGQAAKLGPDFLNEFIGKFVGSLGPGMAEFGVSLSSLLTYPAILGAAEAKKAGGTFIDETLGAITKAGEVGLLGLIFKGLHPFSLYTKAPILGTTFGVEDAAKQLITKGEINPDQVIEATATGVGLALTPGGRMGLKDIRENLRTNIRRAEIKSEVLKAVNEIKPEDITKPETLLALDEIVNGMKAKLEAEGRKMPEEVLREKLKEPVGEIKPIEIKFDQKTNIFVAYEGGKEVGWYEVVPAKEGGFRGVTISVHPEYKRRGIGTELVKQAKEKFGERLGGTEPTEAGKSFLEAIGEVPGEKFLQQIKKPELSPTELESLRKEVRAEEQAGKVSFAPKPLRPVFEFADPTIEKSYQQSIPQKEPLLSRTAEYFTEIWHKMTRPYEYLPRTKEFAQLQFDLKKLEKQKGVASYDAVMDIGKTLAGLKAEDYNLFTRKTIIDDLTREAERGHDLPWGFDKDSLKIEKTRLDVESSQNPLIQDALNKRKAMWDKVKNEYIDSDAKLSTDYKGEKERLEKLLSNENYVRHQVLEYANLQGLFGTGKRLKEPTSRGFLKARKGSELDINRDFIQPEFEVVAQMLYDIQVNKTIKAIDERDNIWDQVKKDAKTKGLEDWHDAIPDGYRTWQPREGNIFYMVDSIPAKLAEKLHSGALQQLGITEKDLRRSLAIGAKRREFVLKEEVANTLDELVKTKTANVIGDADRLLMKGIKAWFLFAPRRYPKYEFRNATGDSEKGFVGNPSGFLKSPGAVRELGNVLFGKKEITGELKEFFDRGGFESTLFTQEMGQLESLWTFERLYREQNAPGIKEVPYRIWKKYWKTIRVTNTFRETILRYANYLDYLEQMKADPNGRPKNFGASKPEEIMGLKDVRDRAYWLQNDLIGAYDRISVMGQYLREYWYPFWSWKELNFRAYTQLIKNVSNEGRLAQAVGRKAVGTLAKTPFMAYKVGKFLISATGFWTALQVWNNTMFPEEEDDLGEDAKSHPHIIFGRDSEGNILYFNRIGALGDYLEWFGLDSAPNDVMKWFRGEKTLKEIAIDMVKSPINVIVSGLTPLVKTPVEVITQRTLFPDAFKPGTIRDRGFYLARLLALENEYKEIAGLPSKAYAESIKNFFLYSEDPNQGGYYDIQEKKRRWLQEQGKGAEGFWLTPKGNALYNLKLAIRYQDLEATNKYMYEYYTLGGTAKGIKESLERMHPLAGLSGSDKSLFLSSLSAGEAKRLEKAMEFYYKTLRGAKP